MKLTHNKKYANIAPRILASLIDSFILTLPTIAGLWYVVQAATIQDLITRFVIFIAAILLPMSIFGILYHVLGIALFGKTIGKVILGLQVTDEKGEKLSKGKALFREVVAKVVNAAVLGFGYFAILFDPKHQGWHDMLTGSLVHKKEERLLIGAVCTIALFAIIGVGYYLIFKQIYTQQFSLWVKDIQMMVGH